jgi:hypothetical protein
MLGWRRIDEPHWKRMVDELRKRKFQSPYLDRLQARLGSAARDDLEELPDPATPLSVSAAVGVFERVTG